MRGRPIAFPPMLRALLRSLQPWISGPSLSLPAAGQELGSHWEVGGPAVSAPDTPPNCTLSGTRVYVTIWPNAPPSFRSRLWSCQERREHRARSPPPRNIMGPGRNERYQLSWGWLYLFLYRATTRIDTPSAIRPCSCPRQCRPAAKSIVSGHARDPEVLARPSTGTIRKPAIRCCA